VKRISMLCLLGLLAMASAVWAQANSATANFAIDITDRAHVALEPKQADKALAGHAETKDGIELSAAGHELYLAARYNDAEVTYRRALQAFGAESSLDRVVTTENLGVALRAQGRLVEAQELLEQSLFEIRQLTGADSLYTAQALANLAALYWSSGKLAKAEATALDADSVFNLFPEERNSERANNQQVLASVYLGQRRYPDAINILRAVLETGGERAAVTAYGKLAVAALGMGDTAQAEKYARRGVDLARRVLPQTHPGRAAVLNNLAQTCRFAGNYPEAEKLYREAIAIWETALGMSHPDVGRGLMNLAAFYHERGREVGAEQLYLRAGAILEEVEPVLALVIRNELADVLRAQQRYTESGKLARATLSQMEGAMRPEDPRLIRARMNWANLLRETRMSSAAAKVK